MQTDEQNRRPSALVRHRLSLIAAAAILAYAAFVHYVWGWGSIVAEWRTIGYGTVAAVIGLLVSTYFVRAWRLYDYFPGETTGRLVELFHLAQVHNLLNIMLPFRSGETSFPLLMRSEFSVPLLHGTSALLVMRLLDLHALLAAGGLGLVLASEAKLLPVVVWLAFLVAPIPAFLLKGPVLAALRPRLRGKLARILDGIVDGLPADLAALLRAWLATVINWGVKVLVFAWALGLMGVAPLAATFGGALGGELSSVLPFHAPAGVGTYSAGIVAGAVALGAPTAGAAMDMLARASINMHLMIILSALTGTVLSLALNELRRLRAGR
ncbi:MAG: lysylphosphatidylglycerol synthase domain-containing protein [Rhizobium sp.]|nr:lysylphosphatidylglycerol synthase domain-containing protein [Rhizobium sp.]